jgi:hypothetical protein
MSKLREAAQQALRVACMCTPEQQIAKEALRAALAQQTQTPCDIAEDGVCEVIDCCRNPTQEEPKPVAWRYKGMMGMPWSLSDDGYYASCKRDNGYMVEPLYTHPPRQWRGLSKDESLKLWGTRSDGPSNSEIIGFARAIEQALKEKNA